MAQRSSPTSCRPWALGGLKMSPWVVRSCVESRKSLSGHTDWQDFHFLLTCSTSLPGGRRAAISLSAFRSSQIYHLPSPFLSYPLVALHRDTLSPSFLKNRHPPYSTLHPTSHGSVGQTILCVKRFDLPRQHTFSVTGHFIQSEISPSKRCMC